MLLSIFVSDTGSGIDRTLSKFVDDTKVNGEVESSKGRDAIQNDLGRLEEWSSVNLRKFSKAKYKVQHLG